MARLCLALTLALVLPRLAPAQDAQPPADKPAPPAAPAPASDADTQSMYDRVWQRFTMFYENPSNPAVQRVLFSGRFQHEFAHVGSEQGDLSQWNTRRLRLGPRVTLFRNYTLHIEAELNPQEIAPFYLRLTDAYLQWSRTGRLVVTVGKQGVPFTADGATSSKDLLAVDRSNLTNNIWFPQEYLPGISVSGRRAPWTYRAGMYSAGEANKQFGRFDGGVATLAVLGYDFGPRLGVSEALLSANYVHQTEDTDNTFTRELRDVLSVNFRLDAGRWGLWTDLSTATGYFNQSDLSGVTTMPYFNVTNNLQIVGRYTYLESAAANGVRLATYENNIVAGRGDEYNELYLGANYFFYAHRLKLQTGLQRADLNDRARDGGEYSGVSWTTGVRIGW